MGSCRAKSPGPRVRTSHLSCPRPAITPIPLLSGPGALGAGPHRSAPPPARTKAAPLAPPGPLHHFGFAPTFPDGPVTGRMETKARRRGDKGAGGRGRGGSPVGRALLPDHLLVRRQQLQAVAAEADAGHAAGRTEAERSDARTDRRRRREGRRESPPPPPRSLCSAASGESQRPGEGSRPAGGGGRWLRPARPSALGPSAALARPRGRSAPPSRPASGAPAPLTQRPCRSSPPLSRPVPPASQTLPHRGPSLGAHPLSQPQTRPVPNLTNLSLSPASFFLSAPGPNPKSTSFQSGPTPFLA